MSIRITATLAILVLGSPALAQGAPAPATPALEPPAPVTPAPASPAPETQACGTQAARYATEKGFALWVTRRGTMLQENPLRPLTPARFVILQVVVNGRLATAFGPDYARLQQGFSPGDLEKDGAAKISWVEGADELPPTIQVVGDDGGALFGPMRFVACGEAPKTKVAASPRPTPKPEPRPKGRNAADRLDREKIVPRMPEGALPGFSIPKGAVN